MAASNPCDNHNDGLVPVWTVTAGGGAAPKLVPEPPTPHPTSVCITDFKSTFLSELCPDIARELPSVLCAAEADALLTPTLCERIVSALPAPMMASIDLSLDATQVYPDDDDAATGDWPSPTLQSRHASTLSRVSDDAATLRRLSSAACVPVSCVVPADALRRLLLVHFRTVQAHAETLAGLASAHVRAPRPPLHPRSNASFASGGSVSPVASPVTLAPSPVANRVDYIRAMRRLSAAATAAAGCINAAASHETFSRALSQVSFRTVSGFLQTDHVADSVEDDERLVNHYLLLQIVGEGAQGKVWLAVDTSKSECVERAVKEVKRPVDSPFRSDLENQRDREALQREIAIMKKCRHPNIATLYEVIDDPQHDSLFLVMQYFEKGALRNINHSDATCAPVDPRLLASFALQIAEALQYLHYHGVVHKDIKPENFLLGANDTIALADFGVSDLVARIERSRGERSSDDDDAGAASGGVYGSRVRGTCPYAAPETPDAVDPRLSPEDAEKRRDVWSLGVSLYQLLYGKLPWPFTAGMLYHYLKAAEAQEPDYGKAVRGRAVPHADKWRDLLRSMLAKSPLERASIDGVVAKLRSLNGAYLAAAMPFDCTTDDVRSAVSVVQPAPPPQDDHVLLR